ncbi:helix-turn-helix transcriptional regulator [Alicyclobacillus suci]|uniref:helix-turn-helix transcriptional regulator n=1 Tax=Alicyclobacillus suci TaxID=2816080 RepID=UPI001A8E0353|nr:helix-turn-helix transcriptional regulator [Alicyclobacillus suci]
MDGRLKKYLDEKGIKQAWLCEKVGISNTALSLIVRGKSLPNLRTAQKIARALGTTVDELWPLEEDESE